MAEAGQCYCVYLDRRAPRAARRDAAGALDGSRERPRPRGAAAEDAVGSLLFVNADDLADAEQWAVDDPQAAGLSETTIAPLMQLRCAADDEGEQADDFGTGDIERAGGRFCHDVDPRWLA